ncbi:MAG TPA: MASE1 domain-containing protein, partial [Terriglobales bacterium]|nr:MASE1 domain-containing protein [Terriglobales bacterium]
MKSKLAVWAMLACVAAAYFLVARLGSQFAMTPGMPSPVWPGSGVAIAAVLMLGPRVWPGIWLGAFLANVFGPGILGATSAQIVGASIGIAAGNTLEALAGGWLVQRFAQGRNCFEQPQNVFRFLVLGAFWSTLISPVIGLSSLSLAGLKAPQFWTAWLIWWLGDAAGAIVVAPLLVLVGSKRPWPVLQLPRILEMAAWLLLLVALCETFFEGKFLAGRAASWSFFVIPLLLWTALRFGRRGAICGCFLLACFVIHGTFRGIGPFAGTNLMMSLLAAEAFVAVIVVMSLMLAADVAQRQQAEAGLRASEQRYRELFESNPQPMWVYDYNTLHFMAVNHSAVKHYGYSLEEFLNMRITELAPLEDSLAPAQSNGEKNAVKPSQKRHRKKDGTIIDVEITRYNLFFDQRPAAMMISSDISERIRAEKEIDRLNKDLEQRVRDRTQQLEVINKELEAFCYSVSHDLRAPLRSIRGFSEVLLERYAPKLDLRGQEFLRRSCESSQMMDRLIEDLLKLSRVTRAELQRRP